MEANRVLPLFTKLIALSAAMLIFGSLTGMGSLSTLGWVLVSLLLTAAVFLAARRILRPLLWSVGRRLLVSYLLLGVLPIPFILGIGYAVLYLASGQMAARRTADEIGMIMHQMEDIADQVVSRLEPTSNRILDGQDLDLSSLRLPLHGAGIELQPADGVPIQSGPWSDLDLLPSNRSFESLSGIGVLADGQHFIFVLRLLDTGNLLIYLPLEPYATEILRDRTGLGLVFPYAQLKPDRSLEGLNLDLGSGITFNERPLEPQLTDGSFAPISKRQVRIEPPSSAAGEGLLAIPNVRWPRFIPLPYIEWEKIEWGEIDQHRIDQHRAEPAGDLTQVHIDQVPLPYIVRTSIAREYLELFDAFSMEESTNTTIASGVLTGIQVMVLMVISGFLAASLLAAVLVFRIARATHRLHQGIAAVEARRFHHRIQFRGRDQLNALIQGFNEMVEHLEVGVAERAERQAIDQQLQVARDLQQSLLPARDAELPGLEIAVDFHPAAAIGGDFYHFTDHENGQSAAMVADVSGHGLGTGIVMAAAQSLLAALSTGTASTSEMLSRLDQQLRHLTDRRTFVTLAHCLFDTPKETVTVTCAGHVYPYRITTDGQVDAIGEASRPLGLTLGGDLRTRAVSVPLISGDLWVLFSDGVVEALDAQGELFGFERFEALLSHCAGKTAAAAEALLIEALRRFAGNRALEDDRTLIVIRVL